MQLIQYKVFVLAVEIDQKRKTILKWEKTMMRTIVSFIVCDESPFVDGYCSCCKSFEETVFIFVTVVDVVDDGCSEYIAPCCCCCSCCCSFIWEEFLGEDV